MMNEMPRPPAPHRHDDAIEDCPDCGHEVFYCHYYSDYFHSDDATCFLHQWTHTAKVKRQRDELVDGEVPHRPDYVGVVQYGDDPDGKLGFDAADWVIPEIKGDHPIIGVFWEDDPQSLVERPIGWDVGGMVHYNRYDSVVTRAFGTVASEVEGQFLRWDDFPFVELEAKEKWRLL